MAAIGMESEMEREIENWVKTISNTYKKLVENSNPETKIFMDFQNNKNLAIKY